MSTISPYGSSFAKPTNTYTPSATIKLVAPLLVLTAGTGGVLTAHTTAELARWVYDPFIHVEPAGAKQVDTRSPAEHVANIRDVFSINMSDLASILGVTRPTVYAWLAGQEPKGEAIVRIQELSRTAGQFKQANIMRLDKLVHRPIVNGYSLLDILKTNRDHTEALATIKAIADKEAQTRREPKGIGKHLRTLDEVLGESSAAIDVRS
ncbi:hypothetical protein PGN35_023820 [Nodosilinea sp. PGN35]|uniref:hypothetical protein n=1 Tax=Nodosilinea sp. PGN35 TaxID=3020489 RepID=UPI0023B31831|nr:hypothetical protein [Nodosilinea sp. TSF1-S3]MDF0370042.1 hypothetical protein [Nodosilinea sp. TSF1-S3]